MDARERLARQLDPWLKRADVLVHRRLRAARSHADTGRLDDAADAVDELEGDAIGHLLQAREQFYIRAFAAQARELDPAIVDPEQGPTPEGIESAKTEPILNSNQVADLRRVIAEARQELVGSGVFGKYQPGVSESVYASWEMRHRDAIGATMTASLSNAQVALYQAVGRIVVKRELQ